MTMKKHRAVNGLIVQPSFYYFFCNKSYENVTN